MERKNSIITALCGITYTISRFPMTVLFLLAAMVLNAAAITSFKAEHYIELLLCFILGASLSIVFQVLGERFFSRTLTRILFMLLSAACSFAYYMAMLDTGITVKTSIRTTIILFMLLIIFLWVPSIKSKTTFNESFMAVFKAFFIAVFFAIVIFIGAYLIIMAIDRLIIDLNEELYLHAANILAVIYAPQHLLSLIPVYGTGRQAADEEAESAGTKHTSRFLEGLICYVIIPVTSIFTVILLIYIIMNITGAFWNRSLLEPMLVSYSVTVIIVYLLSAGFQNVFAEYFRRIFPKVLVPVVLFQTISSVLKINELGVTYGRYYVIFFGLFATACGIIFCIVPLRRIGVIAPILLIMAVISVIPPIDVFTVSRTNQAGRLKRVLEANDMLEGNTIIPGRSLSEGDKRTIVNSLDYLRRLEDTDRYDWLASYNKSGDFVRTFGFNEYESKEITSKYISLFRDPNQMIPITGHDYMGILSLSLNGGNQRPRTFTIYNLEYSLAFEADSSLLDMVLYDNFGNEIIRLSINDFFKAYENRENDSEMLSTQEATYTVENSLAVMTLIAERINMNYGDGDRSCNAEAYILIRLKQTDNMNKSNNE